MGYVKEVKIREIRRGEGLQKYFVEYVFWDKIIDLNFWINSRIKLYTKKLNYRRNILDSEDLGMGYRQKFHWLIFWVSGFWVLWVSQLHKSTWENIRYFFWECARKEITRISILKMHSKKHNFLVRQIWKIKKSLLVDESSLRFWQSVDKCFLIPLAHAKSNWQWGSIHIISFLRTFKIVVGVQLLNFALFWAYHLSRIPTMRAHIEM